MQVIDERAPLAIVRPKHADEPDNSCSLRRNADVLIGSWMTKTRVPNVSTFQEDITIQVLVSEIASICAAPVLRMKDGDASRVTVASGSIFDHQSHRRTRFLY